MIKITSSNVCDGPCLESAAQPEQGGYAPASWQSSVDNNIHSGDDRYADVIIRLKLGETDIWWYEDGEVGDFVSSVGDVADAFC